MRPLLLALLVGLAYAPDPVVYQPNWASLDARPLPEWYDDAKFGIFIHWGVYSVPAWAPVGQYAEWYWSRLENGSGPTYDFHVANYGPDFGYQAELWDPEFWADLIVNSGAKYVVPTSKHHEGFCNWPSAVTWNWNSYSVGPYRDLIGDLFASCRAKGIHAGLYFSLYEWFNPLYRSNNPHQYVTQVMLPQLYDLVQSYSPDILWADGDWEQSSAYEIDFWNSTEFLAYVFNNASNNDVVVVNDRWGNDTRGVHGSFFTAEYSNQTWLSHKWEQNSGMDVFSYGLNRASTAYNYSSIDELLDLLIRTVAYGGNYLLDIGPASDGTIPTGMQDRLIGIGAWLGVNEVSLSTGEAIYSTRQWRVQEEANGQVFYTSNLNTGAVYAIFTEWPDSPFLELDTPAAGPGTQISMLGVSGNLQYVYKPGVSLIVTLPLVTPRTNPSPYAWALKLINVK